MFVNQLDHMAALVRPDKMDATIGQLSFGLQTAFYGPFDRADIGARIATSWDAGITLVSPVPGGDGHIAAALEAQGPGWWTPAYGVDSLAEHVERMDRLGYDAPRAIAGLTGAEPWCDRFSHVEEVSYPPEVYGGLSITLCSVEQYPDVELAAPPSRPIGRVDHAVALVRLADLDDVVAQLAMTLETIFDEPYDRPDVGARIVASWSSGIQLVAPMPGADGYIADEMAARGPGWWSIGFGVRDLKDVRARMQRMGHEPVAVDAMTGAEPWADRFDTVDAVRYDPALYGDLPVTLCVAEGRRAR